MLIYSLVHLYFGLVYWLVYFKVKLFCWTKVSKIYLYLPQSLFFCNNPNSNWKILQPACPGNQGSANYGALWPVIPEVNTPHSLAAAVPIDRQLLILGYSYSHELFFAAWGSVGERGRTGWMFEAQAASQRAAQLQNLACRNQVVQAFKFVWRGSPLPSVTLLVCSL